MKKPSIAVVTPVVGSVAAPRVTNSGVKCSTVGWVVEGLFWLAVVGLVLLLVTGALGVRERTRR